jgi:hypothetical protein
MIGHILRTNQLKIQKTNVLAGRLRLHAAFCHLCGQRLGQVPQNVNSAVHGACIGLVAKPVAGTQRCKRRTAGVSPAFAPASEALALHADATGPAPASLDSPRPPVYHVVNRPSRPKHSPSSICGCALAALNLLRGSRRSIRQAMRWLSGLVIEDRRSVGRSGEEEHRLLFANEGWELMIINQIVRREPMKNTQKRGQQLLKTKHLECRLEG